MSGALAGIKVVDLSRILAGPWASQMLADFGAQVIKIERPKTGDDTRLWGPPFINAATAEQPAQAAYFHCANRNKKSLSLDITTDQGQAIVKQLIADADVVIENYKVGGLKKYGLDYLSISKLNPQLIYCSITGFGQDGPSAHKAGYDAMIQGEGGLMSLTGEVMGDPMKVGVALVDVMTGLYSCNAILAALLARHNGHSGQQLDIALLDVQMAALANQGMNYLATGHNPPRHGNGHPSIVPYQCFATNDGSLILAIGNDSQFEKFCHTASCQHIAQDQRFRSNAQRVKHRSELIPLLATILAQQDTATWIDKLEQVAVPCGPVNTLEQAFNHPQIKHRQMIKQLPDRNGNMVATIASPINMSGTPLQYHSASPELGQHNEQILAHQLGYDSAKIAALRCDGVID